MYAGDRSTIVGGRWGLISGTSFCGHSTNGIVKLCASVPLLPWTDPFPTHFGPTMYTKVETTQLCIYSLPNVVHIWTINREFSTKNSLMWSKDILVCYVNTFGVMGM
jgi:hypothetical protein